MPETFMPVAHSGVGFRLAHDPGDPLITSHCPFCGSGQVAGRSDGTISCDFCGQVYIVRVQPAFPGMPQAPGEGGAPSDIGPDGGVLPPDAMGPDGLPVGGGEMPPGEDVEDEGEPPFGDGGDDEGAEDEGFSGPPGDADDDGPPPPKSKKKSSRAPAPSERRARPGVGVRTYRGLNGSVLTESQYVRHMAAALSGNDPAVLERLREQAAR